MKKGLIFATTLAMALGIGAAVGAHQQKAAKAEAVSSRVVYLKPNIWAVSSPNYEVYSWGGSTADGWDAMTVVATDNTTYKVEIPSDRTGFSFVRMDPSKPASDWDSKWNQTVDLTFNSNPCYKVTSWGENKSSGAWEAYEEPVAAAKYYYSLNSGEYVEMDEGSESQVVSESHTFHVGDTLAFKKDSDALAVTPKDDDAYTKVDVVSNVLTFAQDYTGVLYLNTVSNKLWAGEFDRGFYLNGSNVSWNFKHAPKASEKQGESGTYVVENITLAADDEVKFIELKNGIKEPDYKDIDQAKLTIGGGVDAEIANTNLKFNVGGTFNLEYNSTTGAYSVENPSFVPDIPAQEGYYICGEFSSNPCWRYEDAEQMTQTSEDGNVAYEMNFLLAVDDEFRVRSYFDDRDPKDQWADIGIAMDVTSENKKFVKSGDNLKCVVAGYYDIYAKYEDKDGNPANGAEYFAFYATPHVDSYTVTMVGVKFIGGTKEGTFALADQVAYDETVFNPALHAQDGYVTRGVYTNEACTKDYEYEPHALNAATALYVKYTKVGFYVISGADNWSIDKAVAMNTQGIGENNKAEAYLAGVKANDTYSFVYYDGEMAGQNGLGTNVSDKVAVYEDNHVKFVADGNYAIYFGKDNLIYVNGGLVAFITNFLSETGGECKGNETDVDKLQDVWEEQEGIWGLLSDEEQERIHTPSQEDEEKALIASFTERYNYIVEKYGTAKFHDYIWERNITGRVPAISGFNFLSENNTILFVTIGVTVSAVAALAFFVIKFKKKQD